LHIAPAAEWVIRGYTLPPAIDTPFGMVKIYSVVVVGYASAYQTADNEKYEFSGITEDFREIHVAKGIFAPINALIGFRLRSGCVKNAGK
jgi:hypothetical protein